MHAFLNADLTPERLEGGEPTPAPLAIRRTQAPMNPGQITHNGAPSQLPTHQKTEAHRRNDG
jgi:hypothetical protein